MLTLALACIAILSPLLYCFPWSHLAHVVSSRILRAEAMNEGDARPCSRLCRHPLLHIYSFPWFHLAHVASSRILYTEIGLYSDYPPPYPRLCHACKAWCCSCPFPVPVRLTSGPTLARPNCDRRRCLCRRVPCLCFYIHAYVPCCSPNCTLHSR